MRNNVAAIVQCVLVMGLFTGLADAQTPDFTGIWTRYTSPGQPPGRDPVSLLKPEAKKKVEEYRALVAPAGDTPGGFCLGTGMPGSMLGSGGYPMEIVQRADTQADAAALFGIGAGIENNLPPPRPLRAHPSSGRRGALWN